jgi:hypothetical protein
MYLLQYVHHATQLYSKTTNFNLILSWPAGHICPTYKGSFQVRWDNSIPLFLHAVVYLEVSLFRWTSQNAFSRETAVYKWYCVQCCIAYVPLITKELKYFIFITVLPFNLNFNQKCTIFNRHIINIFVLLLFTTLKKVTWVAEICRSLRNKITFVWTKCLSWFF